MVISFGETIVPSMGIHCLRSWFYDDVTPRGFAFDGALPQACKTPLGKREKDGTIVYELIGIPEEISKFQRLEWVKVNPQLAGVCEQFSLSLVARRPWNWHEITNCV
jgi:hypothetical protein